MRLLGQQLIKLTRYWFVFKMVVCLHILKFVNFVINFNSVDSSFLLPFRQVAYTVNVARFHSTMIPSMSLSALPNMVPILPPNANRINKIIENPIKTINPITNPTVAYDVLVPSFGRLVLQNPVSTPKQLPGTCRTGATEIIAKSRFSMGMLRIRRRKMKKHQLRKFRKRMLAFILRQRQKREIRKEKLFRAELLAKIREAEQFDAEKYVNQMLRTIRTAPKPESKKERLDKVFDLIREHRKETVLLRPKFEDPVPESFDKLK